MAISQSGCIQMTSLFTLGSQDIPCQPFGADSEGPLTPCPALAILAHLNTMLLKHKLALMSFCSQHISGNKDLGHPNLMIQYGRGFMKITKKIKKKYQDQFEIHWWEYQVGSYSKVGTRCCRLRHDLETFSTFGLVQDRSRRR